MAFYSRCYQSNLPHFYICSIDWIRYVAHSHIYIDYENDDSANQRLRQPLSVNSLSVELLIAHEMLVVIAQIAIISLPVIDLVFSNRRQIMPQSDGRLSHFRLRQKCSSGHGNKTNKYARQATFRNQIIMPIDKIFDNRDTGRYSR